MIYVQIGGFLQRQSNKCHDSYKGRFGTNKSLGVGISTEMPIGPRPLTNVQYPVYKKKTKQNKQKPQVISAPTLGHNAGRGQTSSVTGRAGGCS